VAQVKATQEEMLTQSKKTAGYTLIHKKKGSNMGGSAGMVLFFPSFPVFILIFLQ